jgi:hypothetical protein
MTDIIKTQNNVPVRYSDKNDNIFAETVVSMPFFCDNLTAALAVETTSSSVSIPLPAGNSIRITNVGANVIFVKTASSAPVATIPTVGTPGSTPVLPNSSVVFSIPAGHSSIAAISSAAGNTMYVSAGEGG